MAVMLKRAYQFIHKPKPEGADTALVDRGWPRAISKEKLQRDEWSAGRGFAAATVKSQNPFYGKLEQLKRLSQGECLILLYGACDAEHKQAVVLRECLLHGGYIQEQSLETMPLLSLSQRESQPASDR